MGGVDWTKIWPIFCCNLSARLKRYSFPFRKEIPSSAWTKGVPTLMLWCVTGKPRDYGYVIDKPLWKTGPVIGNPMGIHICDWETTSICRWEYLCTWSNGLLLLLIHPPARAAHKEHWNRFHAYQFASHLNGLHIHTSYHKSKPCFQLFRGIYQTGIALHRSHSVSVFILSPAFQLIICSSTSLR